MQKLQRLKLSIGLHFLITVFTAIAVIVICINCLDRLLLFTIQAKTDFLNGFTRSVLMIFTFTFCIKILFTVLSNYMNAVDRWKMEKELIKEGNEINEYLTEKEKERLIHE